MKNPDEIIKQALFEQRKLDDKEILLIIKSVLEKYNIINKISDIILDKEDKCIDIASFNQDNTLYYNMCGIDYSISRHYLERKSIFTFDEFYVLEQLIIILHELRHAIQFNCDYNNKRIIKEIIKDCDINNYSKQVYEQYYTLFPVEKDAEVFAIDKSIELLKKCDYFKNSIIKLLYSGYFKTLISGYDFSKMEDGRLREFYLKVINDEQKYLSLLAQKDSLTLHDKLAYNFPIDKNDFKRVVLIPSMINADFDPRKVLKK